MIRILENIDDLVSNKSIDVLDANTLTHKEFWNNYIDYNKPCLIKDAVKHWPAVTKWKDLNYLKTLSGHNMVDRLPAVNYTGDNDLSNQGRVTCSFSDAIEHINITLDPMVSIPSLIRKNKFSELIADIGTFPFSKKLPFSNEYPTRFFLYKNAGTGWHPHPGGETLMCQITGAKKVGLFNSEDGPYDDILEKVVNERYLNGSDFLKEFKDSIEVNVITVQEGDALYIPPFWWHAVDPVDESIGITLAPSFPSPLHKLVNIRYPQMRQLWKAAFQRPSRLTVSVLIQGLLSLFGQLFWLFKRILNKVT